MKIYNKLITHELNKELSGINYRLIVVKEGNYSNIHIISPVFKDDETNTLYLQDPIEFSNELTPNRLLEYILNFHIWYILDDSSIDVTVSVDNVGD